MQSELQRSLCSFVLTYLRGYMASVGVVSKKMINRSWTRFKDARVSSGDVIGPTPIHTTSTGNLAAMNSHTGGYWVPDFGPDDEDPVLVGIAPFTAR